MTKAIWDMLDPDSLPDLAHATAEALLAGVNPPLRAMVEKERLWGYLSQTRGGPDLLLVDGSNRVRVVVEHKRGAATNYTGLPLFIDSQRFDDAVARSVVPMGDGRRHKQTVRPWKCMCNGHTQKGRDGLVTGAVPQIDAYRAFRWWLRPEVTIDDATKVIWVLLDREARSPLQVFPDAVTVHAWGGTGYPEFIDKLFEEYCRAYEFRNVRAAELLEKVIRMAMS